MSVAFAKWVSGINSCPGGQSTIGLVGHLYRLIVHQTPRVCRHFSWHSALAPEKQQIMLRVLDSRSWNSKTSKDGPYDHRSGWGQRKSYSVKTAIEVAIDIRLWEPEQIFDYPDPIFGSTHSFIYAWIVSLKWLKVYLSHFQIWSPSTNSSVIWWKSTSCMAINTPLEAKDHVQTSSPQPRLLCGGCSSQWKARSRKTKLSGNAKFAKHGKYWACNLRRKSRAMRDTRVAKVVKCQKNVLIVIRY